MIEPSRADNAFYLRHIPLTLLAELTGKPIEQIEKRLANSVRLTNNGFVPVQTAINYAYSLKPHYGTPKRMVKMRLPLLLALTLRGRDKNQEITYRKIGAFIAAQARGTNLLLKCQPAKCDGRVQVKRNAFCPFAWIALKLIAYACDVNASDVFSWAARLYLENEGRLGYRTPKA